MPNYRFYRLDLAGHITSAFDQPFADDADAHARALELFTVAAGVEVWQGARRVHLLNADAPAPARG